MSAGEQVERMASHTFKYDEDELAALAGHTSPAVEELVAKLSAEDARLRRLLPDPPVGHRWVQEIQRSERNPMEYTVRFRVVYYLKKIE